MAAYNKFNTVSEYLGEKVYDFNADTLKILLTNTAPVAANSVKADLTEISAGNGYTAGGTAVASQAWTESGGVTELTGDNVVFTASGGSIGPFRYAVLYDDTPTSPADPLLGWWDYGSELTLLDTQSLTVSLTAGLILDVQ